MICASPSRPEMPSSCDMRGDGLGWVCRLEEGSVEVRVDREQGSGRNHLRVVHRWGCKHVGIAA